MSRNRYPLVMLSYGANVLSTAMARRAPTAEFIGRALLRKHRLVFRGVADVVPDKRTDTWVAVWTIQRADEEALDRFEGYPNMYIKSYVRIMIDGVDRDAMFYVMRSRQYFAMPAQSYEQCLRDGYTERGMPTEQIDKAIEHAARSHSIFARETRWHKIDKSGLDPVDYDLTMNAAAKHLPGANGSKKWTVEDLQRKLFPHAEPKQIRRV